MIFYEKETVIGLIFTSLPAIASVYFFYIKDRKKLALVLLLASAFLLRILMINLDPYVHAWDERYHALVAKNMIDFPFKPMLFAHPVFFYLITDWSYNHIWLHKQPLFLWQMALSMKIFGVNTISLRLPSAVLGTIMVWLIYDIGIKWIRNEKIAFLSAFLVAFAYEALELTSGLLSLDHNDLAFTFYVTCCFWAFVRYVYSDFNSKWIYLIGLFTGLAILNKWLTGLLIFGGWGIWLLISPHKYDIRKYSHLLLSMAITCLIFLPWQFYIFHFFPAESAYEFEFNVRHFSEDMGHPGNVFSHLKYLPSAYHAVLLIFLAIGLVGIFFSKTIDRKVTISIVAMIVAIFSFFSFFVAIKMPNYVYPVSGLIFILMGYGLFISLSYGFKYFKLSASQRNILFCLLTLSAGFFSFKPYTIIHQRSENNKARNAKIHNSTIFKNQDDHIMNDRIILNCKSYENIELMFYKNTTAYHFCPSEHVLDSVQALGYKFAAFQFAQQLLPDYITNDKEIIILQEKETFK